MIAFNDLFSQFNATDCGENLEYSQAFLALSRALEYKPEQQFGETIIEAESPEWHQAERQALALCEQTCDVRVIEMLTRSLTALRGLLGYANGLALMREALTQFWDAIHPKLVEEDGYEDPFPRINAMTGLSIPEGSLSNLRASPLLTGHYGQLTVREAEQVLDGSKTDFPGGRMRLIEILVQARRAEDPVVLALFEAHDHLQAIEAWVVEQLGTEWRPEFNQALALFDTFARVMQHADAQESIEAQAGEQAETGQSHADEHMSAGATAATPQVVSRTVSWKDVAIDNRGDAMLALEKASSYFEAHEPSHPAPFLIRRVLQTIPLNFYDMIKDLVPGSHQQFEVWMVQDKDNEGED